MCRLSPRPSMQPLYPLDGVTRALA
jgi:hypothetical protein